MANQDLSLHHREAISPPGLLKHRRPSPCLSTGSNRSSWLWTVSRICLPRPNDTDRLADWVQLIVKHRGISPQVPLGPALKLAQRVKELERKNRELEEKLLVFKKQESQKNVKYANQGSSRLAQSAGNGPNVRKRQHMLITAEGLGDLEREADITVDPAHVNLTANSK